MISSNLVLDDATYNLIRVRLKTRLDLEYRNVRNALWPDLSRRTRAMKWVSEI